LGSDAIPAGDAAPVVTGLTLFATSRLRRSRSDKAKNPGEVFFGGLVQGL